jgi:hypothetical protein
LIVGSICKEGDFMALKINDRAFLRDVVGMPSTHAAKFLEVSRTTQCIVLCRATGPTCLQLLKQGYDTKGFRVHAKSCDWGSMAPLWLDSSCAIPG